MSYRPRLFWKELRQCGTTRQILHHCWLLIRKKVMQTYSLALAVSRLALIEGSIQLHYAQEESSCC
jgi:hypothetical protein